MKSSERYRDVDMGDVFQFMMYMEKHYGSSVEVNIARASDVSKDALLCITVVGICPNRTHRTVGAGALREVNPAELPHVPKLLHEMLYELTESIEGQCPDCQREAAQKN